jgi:hypothetical protein
MEVNELYVGQLLHTISMLEERVGALAEELDTAIEIIEDSGVDYEEVKQAYLED